MWRILDFDLETAWLGSGGATGFDAEGWEASTWVAHPIYEYSEMDSTESHDEVHRSRVSAGLEVSSWIGDVNLDEIGVLVGGGHGVDTPPTGDRRRVSWAEVADRTGPGFADQTFPPCFKWFPYRSWPSSLEPPTEGSLDVEILDALSRQLLLDSPKDDCFASYGVVSALNGSALPGGSVPVGSDAGECYRGPVSCLVDLEASRGHTPSNFWAADRSWFVYTDWDLWATKVSGTQALIDAIAADEKLETLVWPV